MTRPFPEGFVWGVAAAAYQIEGGIAEGGRAPSIWDTFSHRPGAIANDENGDVAIDHYHRWEADLDLIAELGIDHYRFSIAWPRVMPDGRTLNPEGLAFYDRLVDGMLARGITPLATLYHWDLPQALDQGPNGGWLARATAERFADYARVVGERLGDRLSAVTTLNEPWCSAYLGYGSGEHAPGRRDNSLCYPVAHHLNLAHGLGVQALRSVLPASTGVSVTLNIQQVVAASDDPADQAAARHVDLVGNRIWLDPMLRGVYPDELIEQTRHLTDWSFLRDGDGQLIQQPIDFLGVNYYNPARIAAAVPGQPTFPGTDRARGVGYGPEVPVTVMGWPIVPSGLTDLLLRLHKDYGVPLQVTENGVATQETLDRSATPIEVHDADRVDYLRDHLGAVLDAIDAGADVRGYYEWTLMDNFEWAWGYDKRFGLVHVDFESQERHPKDSARWYARVIAVNALP
jgi:beta-glucosidase